MSLNSDHSNNLQNTANLFADYFSSLFLDPTSSNDNNDDPQGNAGDVLVNNLDLSADKILKGLNNLHTEKGPGPDQIPNLFL